MQTKPPSSGRLVAFRLTDIPLELRVRAAQRVVDDCAKTAGLSALIAAAEVERAAASPSDRIYRVPATAFERVLGKGSR